MPRAEAEVLGTTHGMHAQTEDWKCSSCAAIGQFASGSSDEWRQFANDLVFDAYAANLQKAGYAVEMYSQECDEGDHDHCPGKNRLSVPNSDRCWCACHKAIEPIRREPRNRTDRDTIG
jgi:hypothetical protein